MHQGCVCSRQRWRGGNARWWQTWLAGVGGEDYYLRELADNHEQYLSGHGESPGRWYGAGASSLGLQGEASPAGFQAIFEGRDPSTGQLLSPAATWNEALPIGNGRLGAMVFGGIADERLQLNEETVWAGQKLDRVNPQAAASLPEIRRLLFAGKPAEAEAIADKTIISIPRRMPPYQTLGDLRLRFQLAGEASDYQRELDLDDSRLRARIRL